MKLLFIMGDPPSALIRKGETPKRYYNPGNVFDHVHLLSTTSDATRMPVSAVGNATTDTTALFKGNYKWNVAKSIVNFPLLGKRAVTLARELKPDLIRCGDRLSGYLGARIKRELGIPVIMSLHCQRDDHRQSVSFANPLRWLREWERLWSRYAMTKMDVVVCVYWDIIPYAVKNNARVIKVIYNVVCPDFDYPRKHYNSGKNLIWVSRLDQCHDPSNIIEAAQKVGCNIDIYGDGPQLDNVKSKAVVRVNFYNRVDNSTLVRHIANSDIYVNNCKVVGIPKGVMEAMWCGIPVITNDAGTKELKGDHCLKVRDTVDGWTTALHLMQLRHIRESFGRRGRAYAEEHFHPQKTEQEWADLYLEVIGGRT